MPSVPQCGIEGRQAPEWGVDQWMNLPPNAASLTMADLAGKIVYLYCFQAWCPGCHSHGFPTLIKVREAVDEDPDVAFVAIQTVFEGFEVNTLERAQEVSERYALEIPFGHDPGPDGRRSIVMGRYFTGGTPWTVLIDNAGVVRYNNFHADPAQMVHLIGELKAEAV